VIAFLFAGQGSQKVGMGADLAVACDDCRETFEAADRALGYPLSRLMAKGPEEELRRTAITQPALLAISVAHARHLQGLGVEPDLLAGHSIGQYAALVVAGAIEFDDALRLVAARGVMMQKTVPEGEGAMMAIIGQERERVYAACEASRSLGVVGVALHNAPGQTVISGAVPAVEAAAERCEEEGGVVAPLPVSAPFHCDLLAPMVPAFAELVAATPMRRPALPVLDNVTATPLADEDSVRQSLVEQITSPVLFEESLRAMVDSGVARFVQCGPGKSLLGFVKRVAPQAATETFEEAMAAATAPD